MSKREVRIKTDKRIRLLKACITGKETSMEDITLKAQKLECFKSTSLAGIIGFLYYHKSEIGMPHFRHINKNKAKLLSATIEPRAIPCEETSLNSILSLYSPSLDYQGGQKFVHFVEEYLQPFVAKLQEQASLVPDLKLELQNTKKDASDAIQELECENLGLDRELSKLKQRNAILSDDNEKLQKRFRENSGVMVEHSASVRLRAEPN